MAACDRVKVMALTNEEFESALKHLPRRLAAKNVEIARAILVQGRRQVDLVKESGLSRSAVAALVRKVRQAHEKHGTPPAGWVRVSVCVPVDMAPIVKAIDVNAHCKGTHHVHAKVTHLWGLCARTQSGVLTRGGREA